MRSTLCSLFTVAALGLAVAAAAEEKAPVTFNFDADKPGEPPKGFEFALTGQGAEGKWVVRADKDSPSNRVLVQESADSTDYRFPLAVVREGSYKDLTLSVRARPVSGEVDQGFGLVWRYQDANNYYIARMNPLEDNFRVYKVVAGKRIQLDTKEGLKVSAGTWHMLSVRHVDDTIVCSLDGKKYLEATDSTFTKAGKIGLWTKADAQSHFDGLHAIDLGP